MPPTTLATLTMLMTMTLWSSSLIGSKSLVDTVTVSEIVLVRFGIGAAVLWAVILLSGQRFRLRDVGLRPVLMGFIEPGLVTLLIVTGLTLTSAMTAALIFSLMPIIQPFTGRLILGEPVRPAVVIGAAIAIAGTAVFIAGQDAGTHSLLGDALVAAGMLCSCANQLLARRVAQRRGRPMAVSALQLTAAAGVGMCALLTIDRPDSVLGGGDRQNVVLTLVYLGVFASAVPFFLYNFSLRSLPVGRISLFVCLLAPLATPMSAVHLGTSIRLFDIAAMMIVVVGILLPAILESRFLPALLAARR